MLLLPLTIIAWVFAVAILLAVVLFVVGTVQGLRARRAQEAKLAELRSFVENYVFGSSL